MKIHIFKILCLIGLIMVFSLSVEVFGEEDPLGEIISRSGELDVFAVEASEGNINFNYLNNYFKELFTKEILNIKNVFFSLFCIVIISSLKECFTLSEEIASVVTICISSACVLVSTEVMTVFFELTKDCISELGDFMLFSFPYLCSLIATSGKTLTAAKGSLISLGTANLLSYLMENFFIIIIYMFYILSVSSSVIENDIFKYVKKTIIGFLKISLPFVVGIYTSVLTIFLKTSSYSDDFVLKTTKTLLSTGIPFLGNVLNKSADTVLSSVRVLKSQAGIAATVAILFLFSVPVIRLICGMLVFKALSVLSSFLGNEKITVLFSEMGDTVAFLAGICGTMTVVGVISIVLLI